MDDTFKEGFDILEIPACLVLEGEEEPDTSMTILDPIRIPVTIERPAPGNQSGG